MTEEANPLTCYEFQAKLPEMIGSGESLAAHAHLQHCALCRALLSDLETIAEAARLIFPIVGPPDNVWKQIESAIKKEKGVIEPDERKE
jgi:hypothetical protein